MKRRTVPRPLPTGTAAAAVGGNAKGKSADPPTKNEVPSTKTQEGIGIQRKTSSQGESKPKHPAAKPSSQERKGVGKTPSLKREQSDIFKSFAKTAAKVSRNNTDSSAGASPASEVCTILSRLCLPGNLTSNDQESGSATKAPAHKDEGTITPLLKDCSLITCQQQIPWDTPRKRNSQTPFLQARSKQRKQVDRSGLRERHN